MADLTDISPYLEGLFLSETMQDWVQSSRAYRKGSGELNPLLGKHPSQAKMTAFGTAMDAAQYAGYKALSDEYKLPYAALSAILEGINVHRSVEKGYPLDKDALALGALLTAALVYDDKKEKGKKQSIQPALIDGRTPGLLYSMQW